MSEQTGHFRAKGCYRKKRYASEEMATAVASNARLKRNVNLRVYCCYECGGWHVTSRIKNKLGK